MPLAGVERQAEELVQAVVRRTEIEGERPDPVAVERRIERAAAVELGDGPVGVRAVAGIVGRAGGEQAPGIVESDSGDEVVVSGVGEVEREPAILRETGVERTGIGDHRDDHVVLAAEDVLLVPADGDPAVRRMDGDRGQRFDPPGQIHVPIAVDVEVVVEHAVGVGEPRHGQAVEVVERRAGQEQTTRGIEGCGLGTPLGRRPRRRRR